MIVGQFVIAVCLTCLTSQGEAAARRAKPELDMAVTMLGVAVFTGLAIVFANSKNLPRWLKSVDGSLHLPRFILEDEGIRVDRRKVD